MKLPAGSSTNTQSLLIPAFLTAPSCCSSTPLSVLDDLSCHPYPSPHTHTPSPPTHHHQPRLGDPATSGGGLILSTILVAWGTAIVLGGKGLLAKDE